MKIEKITILIITILMLTFTVALDIFVYYGLDSMDLSAAYILVLANILVFGLVYICFLFLTKKQDINRLLYEKEIKL